MPVLQPLPKRREVENPNDVPIQTETNDRGFKQEDPEQAEVELEKVIIPAYLIGFKNRGNTCYINASIQATIGLCFFVQRIISTFEGSLKFGKR